MIRRGSSVRVASAMAALLIACLPNPGGRGDEVDDFVEAELERHHIPGVAVAVVKHGEVVKLKGYGLANVEHGVAVTPETIFQSGSVGKQFTAMAVMLLVEEGCLDLDRPVVEYLDGAPTCWEAITIRHLLTHTSGIGDMYEGIDLRRDYSEDELVERAAAAPVEFAPGEKWRYSNTGYVLLGVLIHRASGQPYGDFLRDRIFGPLGMSTARLISEADIVPHRAAGYRLVDEELKNQEWVSPTFNSSGDGALYLSAIDLLVWDAALREQKLLSPEHFAEVFKPVTLRDGSEKS